MKIEYLHIRNYKQFLDLELDLTYPLGHEKEGKPLDKICIIGQSGTGKTNLLNIIKKSVLDFSKESNYLPFSKFIGKNTDDKYITNKFQTHSEVEVETLFTTESSKITFSSKDEKELFEDDEKSYFVDIKNYCFDDTLEENEIEMSENDKRLIEKLQDKKDQLLIEEIDEPKKLMLPHLGLPALDEYYGLKEKTANEKRREINSNIELIKERYKPVAKSLEQLKSKNFIDKHIIDINNESENLWSVLRKKVDSYQNERTQYITKLSNKLITDENYDKKDYKEDLEKWESENANLLEKIADDINFILKKFNLELSKIDKNQKSYHGLVIKDLANDSIIEYDDLSTGTKNLLSTFIPLKIHKPKDSIILIDEPEMSFYPDIQKQLIELYETVGLNNQLVVATHSPIIASSFEPWEVVELKFDKDNQIYREKYYDGKNHIDNYTLDPRLLTWTGILTDVFDLKEDSNFTFREKKLMEYASLKVEIKAMSDKEQKEEKFKELTKLSHLLGLAN
jgi:predicted ATPase